MKGSPHSSSGLFPARFGSPGTERGLTELEEDVAPDREQSMALEEVALRRGREDDGDGDA
jgi:hypothetical protein